MNSRFLPLAAAALVLAAGCDLLAPDTSPPTCSISSPADSSLVSGTVTVTADAADSFGVARVEIFADGVSLGSVTSPPYSADWQTQSLPERSWHYLNCLAVDDAGNIGYSDTVRVQVMAHGAADVFHGELAVGAGSYEPVVFSASAGDSLIGDLLVKGGATISSFLWLDRDNYQKFQGGQSFTALLRRDNVSQATVREAVPATADYYLVFQNSGGSSRVVWARFVTE